MIDINLIRTNPDLVRENIKKKFQDAKLPLVDEVIELDKQNREANSARRLCCAASATTHQQADRRADGQGPKGRGRGKPRSRSPAIARRAGASWKSKEEELAAEIQKAHAGDPQHHRRLRADRQGRQRKRGRRALRRAGGAGFRDSLPCRHHGDALNGIDLDSARRTSGNGFYYLKGDIARLHSAILSYARDFMIDRGFTYYIPPFMIRSNVVTGVMSFAEMENMMYKIEGEDLYLIGTSEHSHDRQIHRHHPRREASCRRR